MATQTLVIDPAEVATGRTALDLNGAAIGVRDGGLDWGDAAIEAYLADQQYGSTPLDFRVPNRMVTIPLNLGAGGGLTFTQARAALQQKAAILQSEGGWLKRGRPAGDLFLDVVGATLTLPDDDVAAREAFQTAVLVLECLPDFYGAEVTLGVHSETTNPELIFTEASVQGNFPARLRAVITELQGADQLSAILAFRARYYDAASTARLAYEAEALTALDVAAIATRTGASGGATNNVMRHASLNTFWTPLVSSTIAGGGGEMTHKGSYRVFARVYSGAARGAVRARLVYGVGDVLAQEVNETVATYSQGALHVLDLGLVVLRPAPVGTHRWLWQIQAKGAVGGEDLEIDRVWIVPASESFTIARASLGGSQFTSFIALDRFDQTAGNLGGKTAPTGGAWAKSGGAGADIQVDATNHVLTRSVVTDTAGLANGIFDTLATPSPSALSILAKITPATIVPDGVLPSYDLGVIARYVNTSNFLLACVEGAVSWTNLMLYKIVAGVATQIGPNVAVLAASTTAVQRQLRLDVDAAGNWFLWFQAVGATFATPIASGYDAALALGGALASGKVGVFDQGTGAGSVPARSLDDFQVFAPSRDAVAFASQTAQLTTQGGYRTDPSGNGMGRIATQLVDLPRLPVTQEGRTLEAFLKASRGDLATLPDPAIDDVRLQLFYRPCWLQVPG